MTACVLQLPWPGMLHLRCQAPLTDHASCALAWSTSLHQGTQDKAACWGSLSKLTWLVLGEDQAARSHRVEQLTAL